MDLYDILTPPYTPSHPTPHYSSELLPGEQTIEFTRHASSRPLVTGVYRRITDHITIVLREQYPGSVYPIYGRNDVIRGDVTLNLNTSDLTSVVLKVEGHFILRPSGPPVSTTFLSATHVLWSASHSQPCSGTIAFKVKFPLTFDDGPGDRARVLPPTFESNEPHGASQCSYSLTVELLRPYRLRSFLKGKEAVKVPLVYRPRSRPHLPILSSDLPFMSTVKTSPEEWREVMCTVPMSQGSNLAPVECLLFIPSVQTYALSDAIPFHLQIRGSPASLIPFLEQGRGGRPEKWHGGAVIKICLLRQVHVTIHGQYAAASLILGEGKIQPSQSLPSSHHAFLRHPLGEGLDSLDWDGVLRCGEDVTVPSFFTNQFFVKDLIVLSITPRQPLKSPILGVKHSCPIRLVTDPWSNDAVL